jgi:hypothetical protein
VRVALPFKAAFLGQTSASATIPIRAMIVKTFMVLSFFVHAFAFLCRAARRDINYFPWFRWNRFRNCRAALSFEPGQIVKIQTRPTATSR